MRTLVDFYISILHHVYALIPIRYKQKKKVYIHPSMEMSITRIPGYSASSALTHSPSPFINHSSYKSSKAVGRSWGFHRKAIRSHRIKPSLSSPWTFSARLVRVISGMGTASFQVSESSQKAELRCLWARNSGGGGPSRATSSAMWTRSSNTPFGFWPWIRVRGLTMSQA